MSDRRKYVIALLQEINGRVEGVKEAPIKLPSSLNSARMPHPLIFEGTGETTGFTGLKTWSGQYLIEFYMSPITHGVVGDQFEKCMDFADRFDDAYMGLLEEAGEGWMLDYGVESGYWIEIDRSKEFNNSGARADMPGMKLKKYFMASLWVYH